MAWIHWKQDQRRVWHLRPSKAVMVAVCGSPVADDGFENKGKPRELHMCEECLRLLEERKENNEARKALKIKQSKPVWTQVQIDHHNAMYK